MNDRQPHLWLLKSDRSLVSGIPQHARGPLLDILHHLLLSHAHTHAHVAVTIHIAIPIAADVEVFDETEPEGTSAILISGELGNGCLTVLSRVELHDACAAGAAVGFVLNFGTFNFANGLEEFDKIVVARGPG